ELDLLLGQLLQVAPDPVGLRAAAADDDARAGGVDVHPHALTGALDLDLGDSGPLHAAVEHAADGHVFLDVVLVLLVGVPAALVIRGHPEPEPVRVDLLPHYRVLSFVSLGSTTTVMWLVRLVTRKARPKPRGRMRLRVGPSSTHAAPTTSVSRSSLSLCSALAMALASTFPTGSLAACGANRRTACASSAGNPRIRSTTRRALRGVTRTNRACALVPIAFPSLTEISSPRTVGNMVLLGCATANGGYGGLP